GKTLKNSALRSFESAWRTIVAADTVSFIAAIVLWYLTVGSVQGLEIPTRLRQREQSLLKL
ncbi:MAG: hypothetical protein ACKO8F_03840, partial [Acidimicrobiaceae bacterium]